jgi:hypothetical protein
MRLGHAKINVPVPFSFPFSFLMETIKPACISGLS